MIVRWLVRVALTVAAFFSVSTLIFLVFFSAAWTGSLEDEPVWKTQFVSNLVTTVSGIVAAIVVWRLTRKITSNDRGDDAVRARGED